MGNYSGRVPRLRDSPWGWAMAGSLLMHLSLALVLGYTLNSALQRQIPLQGPFKVKLISLPKPTVVKKSGPPRRQEPPPVPEPVPKPPKKPDPAAKKLLTPKPATGPKPDPKTLGPSPPQPLSAVLPKPEFETTITPTVLRELETSRPSAPPPTESEVEGHGVEAQVSPFQLYANLVRTQIDRVKRYPLMARKTGKEGRVGVQFEITAEGKLKDCRITSSSGTRALDQAALKAVHRASPFQPLPAALGGSQIFRLQINFSLQD